MHVRNTIISKSLGYVTRYFGWRNWSVLRYNSIAENLFLIFYIALRNQLYSGEFMIDLFIFVTFSMFSTTYGYLINDLADKELDARHEKDNTFKEDTAGKAVIIVSTFLGLSIAAGTRFIDKPLFILFWTSWLFIATFYSLKPLRLKERGITGLLFVVIAQRVLPTLLVFSAFNYFEWVDVSIFTLYIFFRGLSSDLNHQLEDYRRDMNTGTETFAIQAGTVTTEKVFQYSLEIEKILMIPCLLKMYSGLMHLEILDISLIFPILAGYVILYSLNIWQVRRQEGQKDANPYKPGRKDIVQFIHHTFPSVVLPFYLLIILLYEARNYKFAVLMFIFIIYRKLYSIELIRNSYPIKSINCYIFP